MAAAVRGAGRGEPVVVESAAELCDEVRSRLRDGDGVVTMGAGSIASLGAELTLGARPAKAVRG